LKKPLFPVKYRKPTIEKLVGQKRHYPESLFDDDVDVAAGMGADEGDVDPVVAEVTAYKNLPLYVINKHKKNGIVDHFSLFAELRLTFPIHYVIFCMNVPALAVEANVKRTFSCAKGISDPNMLSSTLEDYVFIARNLNVYFPRNKPGMTDALIKKVKAKYITKYGGHLLAPTVLCLSVCIFSSCDRVIS
jgi:hypothetical protein